MDEWIRRLAAFALLFAASSAYADDAGAVATDDSEPLVKVSYGIVSAAAITAIVVLTRQPNNGLGGINGMSAIGTASTTQ